MNATGASREGHDEGFQIVGKRTSHNKTFKSSSQTMLRNSFDPLSEWCPVQAVEAKIQESEIEYNAASGVRGEDGPRWQPYPLRRRGRGFTW